MFRTSMLTVLLLATGVSYAADRYQCHGVYETKGFALLNIMSANNFTVNANWSWSDSQNETHKAMCFASYGHSRNTYNYFDTMRNNECPVDYVRMHRNFIKDGKGIISLVSREGGDTHDSSGYTYAWFYCQKH